MQEENKKHFKFRGEPAINVYLGLSSVMIIVALGIGFILIWKLKTIVLGLFLILLMVFSLRNAINKVIFQSEMITVFYLFGQKKYIEYNQCSKLYKSNDGILHAPINILKYKDHTKERKITFVCEDEELKELCEIYFNGFVPK